MLKKSITSLREKSPLVHCLTNYVTVNDCANIILACGASPVMSDEILDCVDITSISNSLLINIGTLTQRTVLSMKASIKKANELGLPVILDPVGAGATAYRTATCTDFIDNCKISAIRGNISEIKALSGISSKTKGVDASCEDAKDYDNIENIARLAFEFSKKTGSIISISGKIDIVSNGTITFSIDNGNKKMGSITGTGCQSSALLASFLASNCEDKDSMLQACVASAAMMGVAGEVALEKHPDCGNSSYRNYIIDEISNMSLSILEDRANIKEIRL